MLLNQTPLPALCLPEELVPEYSHDCKIFLTSINGDFIWLPHNREQSEFKTRVRRVREVAL